MKCVKHETNEAIGVCSKCGRAVCELCVRVGSSALTCEKCRIEGLRDKVDKKIAILEKEWSAAGCGLFLGVIGILVIGVVVYAGYVDLNEAKTPEPSIPHPNGGIIFWEHHSTDSAWRMKHCRESLWWCSASFA